MTGGRFGSSTVGLSNPGFVGIVADDGEVVEDSLVGSFVGDLVGVIMGVTVGCIVSGGWEKGDNAGFKVLGCIGISVGFLVCEWVGL